MEQTAKPAEAPKPKGKKLWVVIAAIIIVAIVGVAAYYVFLPPPEGTPVSIFETTTGTCTTAANCGFNPASKPITTGTKITWTNNGSQPHTATACSSTNTPVAGACPQMDAAALPSFDSGVSGLSGGQKFSFTFSTAGTYYYYCRIHTFMHANVTVT